MKWTLFLTVIVGFISSPIAWSQEISHLVQLDSKYSHHVLVVEKSTHSLYLYQEKLGKTELLKTYRIATGKFKGNKTSEGDHKTPEGIYHVTSFLSESTLKERHGKMASMYGPGAFPLNYPNLYDDRIGKTGSGIWIHSTDDESRIDKGLDSRGCVVLTPSDLKDLSQYLDLEKTPVIIVQDIILLKENTFKEHSRSLLSALETWMKAWQEKDFKTYISQYHEQDFKDSSKGGYQSFKSYKHAVFSRPDKPSIQFNFLSVLSIGDYAIATMEQDYRSAIINDVGFKTVYLKKNAQYDWKIIAELWRRVEHKPETAFVPKQRYFP